MKKAKAGLLPRVITKPTKLQQKVRRITKKYKLNTVCEQTACPNIYECFNSGSATFLILGNKCTRNCSFCLIEESQDLFLDLNEPYRLAEAISKLGLKYVVITSVARDDLADGGASIFANTVSSIRRLNPKCLIEVLTPDFQGKEGEIEKVLAAQPIVFAHNIETVKRLYHQIRPQADYDRSLRVIREAKSYGLFVKSGLMIGLGEDKQEIINAMDDIRAAGCDILTIGQYLRPTPSHREVKTFYRLQDFTFLEQVGLAMNFKAVESMPLVRSSYKAYELFMEASAGNRRIKEAS